MSGSLLAEPHWIALTASSAARSRSADSSSAVRARPYPSRKASRRWGLPSQAPYSRRTRSRTARPPRPVQVDQGCLPGCRVPEEVLGLGVAVGRDGGQVPRGLGQVRGVVADEPGVFCCEQGARPLDVLFGGAATRPVPRAAVPVPAPCRRRSSAPAWRWISGSSASVMCGPRAIWPGSAVIRRRAGPGRQPGAGERGQCPGQAPRGGRRSPRGHESAVTGAV